MELNPGTRLGRYELLGPLGAGGMGEVYRARDERLGREVAIKVLPPAFANDPGRIARFEREARVLASLNHSGIAAIYELGEQDGNDRGPEPRDAPRALRAARTAGGGRHGRGCVTPGPVLQVGRPRLLFTVPKVTGDYDVAPDGQSFVMVRTERRFPPTEVIVVLNWLDELKRLVPARN